MKAATIIIIILLILGTILGIYLWKISTTSYNLAAPTPKVREKIELEKIFKNEANCDECGLSYLD